MVLADHFRAMTVERRALHELLVDGLSDEKDPSQNESLQLTGNMGVNGSTRSSARANTMKM